MILKLNRLKALASVLTEKDLSPELLMVTLTNEELIRLEKAVKRVCHSVKGKRESEGDNRWYGIQRYDEVFNEILEKYMSLFEIDLPRNWFALYNEVRSSPEGSGAGWHRDSYQNNYKVLVYLSDVNELSDGPFQYIASHSSRMRKLVSMTFSFFKINWTRYNTVDERKIKSVFGPKGTLFFVNTSIIHRGAPGIYRDALTYYMFYNVMPDKYNDYVLERSVR